MSNIFQRLLETGLPTRDVQVALGENVDNSDTQIATQATHDNLNVNANVQTGDADVSASNRLPTTAVITADGVAVSATDPLPVATAGPSFSTYTFPAPNTWGDGDATDAFDLADRSHFSVAFETVSGTAGDTIQIEGSPDNSNWAQIGNIALEEITHSSTFAVHHTLENVAVRYVRLRNQTGGMLNPSFGGLTGAIAIAMR
jgi:hypothetical protein